METDSNIKLVPIKKCICKKVYEMYQDIPKKEIGSINNIFGVDYNEFLNICNKRLKEETIVNEKVGSTTKRYILFHNDYPIGEVGIRTTINDYWENKGSQIFYKIRKSKRNKGYGNLILKLALIETNNIGFKKVRINCDDKNEFSISLQPRINLNDMDNICFEALLYWNHPVLGRLDSDYFIKQADEMGIIVKLDRFVLDNMCKKLTELKNNGYTNIQMAVNISTRHFMKDDFTNELCKILEKNNVSKGEVILELTNNIDLKKINMYRSMFEKLKKSGAKISINNFNIKYEDMILYNNLNIDEIKLYAKYMSKESDLNDNCLENVIKLSKDLESEITICCIETKEQLEKAIKCGADKVQGFFLFNKMYDEYISDVIKKYDKLKEKVYKVISDVK